MNRNIIKRIKLTRPSIFKNNDFNFFVYGFVFMATTLLLLRCASFGGNDIDNENTKIEDKAIDYKGISDAGKKIEDFLSAKDTLAINELKFSDARDQMLNNSYTEQELEVLSKAFKKRKLTVATSLFAEYTYTIDGEDYTMTMGCDSEGNWHIIRF